MNQLQIGMLSIQLTPYSVDQNVIRANINEYRTISSNMDQDIPLIYANYL